ncbi:hypothetical protein XENTR_v10009688 [Xenopus tropicalis]|nr:hypothetical protein XENTR_v10009688 [Xenopus tropicalis]
MIDKTGYNTPVFCGVILSFLSTLTFAFTCSQPSLVFARVMQGMGSSFSSVAGMGLVANEYTDDIKRGQVMGIAIGGVAMGQLVGLPLGSAMYESGGKTSPFLLLAFFIVLEGALQIYILRPAQFAPPTITSTSYFTLLKDPYILVAAGTLCVTNLVIGVLESSVPAWMRKTMCSTNRQIGLAFLPQSVAYLLCSILCGFLGQKLGRYCM